MNPVVSSDRVCRVSLASRWRLRGRGVCCGKGQRGVALEKKAGDAGKLTTAFEEELRTRDAAKWLEMCVDHAATISTCTIDLLWWTCG